MLTMESVQMKVEQRFGSIGLEKVVVETVKQGISDEALVTFNLAFGVLYNTWHNNGGLEQLAYSGVVDPPAISQGFHNRMVRRFDRKAIRFALRELEGSWLTRLKNHILFLLGQRACPPLTGRVLRKKVAKMRRDWKSTVYFVLTH